MQTKGVIPYFGNLIEHLGAQLRKGHLAAQGWWWFQAEGAAGSGQVGWLHQPEIENNMVENL